MSLDEALNSLWLIPLPAEVNWTMPRPITSLLFIESRCFSAPFTTYEKIS